MSYPPQQPYDPRTPAPYPQQIIVTPAQVPASGLATASMVLGLLGVFGGWCLLGIPCVLAVITGHVALVQTRDGLKSGRGQAVTGLILGYLFVVPTIIVFILFVLGSATGTPTPTPTAT